MDKREKVIRGLECCVFPVSKGFPYQSHIADRSCEVIECPYRGDCDQLLLDSLELLKVQEIPDTNAGKWISVKDRMPERAGKYLVVSKTALAELPPYVKTAWFLNNLRDNSQFKYDGEPNEPGFYNGDGEGDWVERYITHWMALPEPPKEEGTC